jgi:hypothetical protein
MSVQNVLGKTMGNSKVVKTKVPEIREKENLEIYIEFQKRGFSYIYNPAISELHDLKTNNFHDSHNLKNVHLERFIAIWDVRNIECFESGTSVFIHSYDIPSAVIGVYTFKKCKVCFPNG